jgi:serine/threonine-protein kinase
VHSDVPPVTDEAPGVPVELDDLILAATRRDPMARPRDAGAFLAALVALRARLGLARVPVPIPRAAGSPAVAARGPAGTQVVPVPPQSPRPQQTAASATVVHPPAKPPTAVARRSRFRRWALVTLVVVLLAAAAAAGGWWLGSGRWAYTPGAVGVPKASAEKLVRSAGLVPRVTVAPSDTVQQGTVSDSDPAPGARVLRGSDVDLVVSTGRPVVPNVLAGGTVDAARQLILGAHLMPVLSPTADRYDAVIPVGAVLGTEPAAATALPIGAAVVVIRSNGPAPQPVPSVAGKSVDDAQNKLLVAGFRLGPEERRFDATADDGAVVGTDPAVGVLTPVGSSVSLVLATSITVPLVRGESSSQAATDLSRSGLTVVYGPPTFDPDIDGGSVASTDPAGGTKLDPASAVVTVTLSSAVVVPDVTQGDVGNATAVLNSLGLQVEVTALFGRSGASVTGQLPSAGARLEPGSTVYLSAFP